MKALSGNGNLMTAQVQAFAPVGLVRVFERICQTRGVSLSAGLRAGMRLYIAEYALTHPGDAAAEVDRACREIVADSDSDSDSGS